MDARDSHRRSFAEARSNLPVTEGFQLIDHVQMPWGNPGLVLASRLQRRRRCRKPGLGKYAVLEVIRRGAADVIMTDLHQEGGLAAMKKVLGLCEMAGLPFVNHAYNATTLTITAHMHAMSSSSAYMLALQGHPDLLR